MSAFFDLHCGLPREGPGEAADIDWVLGRIPAPGRVFDAGCGPGADAVTLARLLPGARITAVDRHPTFAAEAARRLRPFGARARAQTGDMAGLTGPADLVWSAGAVYFLGIGPALRLWRPVLAAGGLVAFSGPLRLGPETAATRRFWQGNPTGTAAMIEDEIRQAGWRLLASRVLAPSAWEAYYRPLQARIDTLRPGAAPGLARVLDEAETEIALWRSAPDEIAYLLCLVAPDEP